MMVISSWRTVLVCFVCYLDEFDDGLERRMTEEQSGAGLPWAGIREFSLATGKLAFPYLRAYGRRGDGREVCGTAGSRI